MLERKELKDNANSTTDQQVLLKQIHLNIKCKFK